MANKEKVKIFKIGGSYANYVPVSIKNDSTFPFKEEEPLIMEIDKDKLIIRRPTKQELTE